MNDTAYTFEGERLAELLLRTYYPERTSSESAIIRDYLRGHINEYDRMTFSVRVGAGNTPDPSHLPGVQASTSWSSRMRIDVLAWRGKQPTIIEAKHRIRHNTLGQLITYRELWMREHPEELEPRLIAIGRQSDPDTIGVLQASGITVYLYEPEPGEGEAAPAAGE